MTLPRWPGRRFTLRGRDVRLLWFRILSLAALSALSLFPLALGVAPPKKRAEANSQALAARDLESIAESFYQAGKTYYERFQYREAANSFRAALKAKPDKLEAEYLLRMCEVLMGEGAVGCSFSTGSLVEKRAPRQKRARFELQRLYDRGLELLTEESFDRALSSFEQVIERIRWSPYPIDPGGLEDKARAHILQAHIRKRERAIAAMPDPPSSGCSSSFEDPAGPLIKRAVEQLSSRRFAEASRTLDLLDAVAPGRAEAARLRDIAKVAVRATQDGEAAGYRRE